MPEREGATVRIAAATAATAAIALALAAPAHADQWEYVTELDNHGVYYSNINDVIDTGKRVCSDLRQFHDANRGLMVGKLSGYPPKDAGFIMISATMHMCQDEYSEVHDWIYATINRNQG